ncbi:FtsX-like permease family protein [Rubrobacter marinus]|uniref:Cell division protein FtsX n=1 Tax=Rubrobacter marinus TaxID=2653852 RepID=A0A6G8PX40_9ACTN|nr:permease-like cell division protein FtsX [Rubrobacter marinus]QIN78738.1 FtsX-like permease family protein [Rubrobacter marinus]
MRFNLGFFLREAAKNMRLNALMSVTAVTTTAVCVLVLGVGLLVSAHVEGILRGVGKDVAITAFFPEDVTREQIDQDRRQVEGYPEVEEVVFVSEAEALNRVKDMLSEQPEVMEGLDPDIMQASMEIRLADPEASDAVAERLRAEGFSEENLNYPQQTISQLNQVTGYVIWALRAATVLFLVASVLLISNAIRISIFARRKEIEVMKLVGASDGFVRTPFVLEGLAQGLIGATIAALVVVWGNAIFVEWASSALPFVPVSSSAVNTLLVLLVLIAVGVLIGIVGSFVSVRRFLRV